MKLAKFIFLLAFLFTACGQAVDAAATPRPTIAPAITETPARTFFPAETITTSPPSTLTPDETLTPSFSPTIDQTEVVVATSRAAYFTEAAAFGTTCDAGDANMNMSPDGEWTFCDIQSALNVVNRTGTKWIFSYSNDLGKDFLGYTKPIQWSVEEHLLYFAPMAFIDGVRPVPYNALALYRMDLSSGNVQTVLPPRGSASVPHLYTLSISPTGRRLAYIIETSIDNPAEIIVLDLRTGEKRSIHPGAASSDVGWFTWSPDGLEMTYSVYDPSINKSFYFTYDMTTFQLIHSEPFNP